MNYYIKKEYGDLWKKKYKNTYMAKEIGISNTYMSLILNRKKICPKRIAYCITKMMDKEKEINDFFEVA